MINAERLEAGLEALKIEAHLNAAAQSHSDWMADTGDLSHTGEDGSDVADRAGEAGFPLTGEWKASENLAYVSTGEGDEAERMHEGLMDSPGHRANILDPDVSFVGVGFASGELEDGREALYLTQNFGETEGRTLVQEETADGTVLQPYEDGAPVGEPEIVRPSEPEEEPEEEEDDDDSGGGGGGCFVATAAYGDRAHPDVAALRRYRDEVLVRSAGGRAFIRAYWVIGPKLAGFVSPKGPTGRAARAVIGPLARLARRRE